jgi:hypothetical protein
LKERANATLVILTADFGTKIAALLNMIGKLQDFLRCFLKKIFSLHKFSATFRKIMSGLLDLLNKLESKLATEYPAIQKDAIQKIVETIISYPDQSKPFLQSLIKNTTHTSLVVSECCIDGVEFEEMFLQTKHQKRCMKFILENPKKRTMFPESKNF